MDLIGFFKDIRNRRAITQLRADKFDKLFSKHQANFVIDMNAESTDSEGEDDDVINPEGDKQKQVRALFTKMKKQIRLRKNFTELDMRLLQMILYDQRKLPNQTLPPVQLTAEEMGDNDDFGGEDKVDTHREAPR